MENKKILNPEQVQAKLYDYQLEAVKNIDSYISDYSESKTKKSFLVSMPTGSGKTAIIGALACCYPIDGWVLVLSPRRPVVDQLHKELSGVLFREKFKGLVDFPTREVNTVDADLNKVSDSCVLCWTIHKLNNIRKGNQELFKELKKKVKMILFDEGHYEPAYQWSKAVRSFNVPRVIFTATPFRNDFNEFDIDWDNYLYRKTFNQLLKEKILRKVEVQNLESMNGYENIAKDAIKRFEVIKNNHKSAKLIIKCDSSEAIIAVSKKLKNLNKKFVAIHEAFDSKFKSANPDLSSHLYKSVPKDQSKMEEDIWVHQYKLIEGIDNANFRCLAIVDSMTNTRALVQQIGRIIRNPTREDTSAFVFNYTNENYKQEWNGFLKLDDNNSITKTLVDQVFDYVSSKVDEYQYVDKKIRSKLTEDEFVNWEINDLKENLQLPLKANFIEKKDGFDHDIFINNFLDQYFRNKQHKFFKNIYGPKSGLYLYFNIQNSPYLTNAFFPEITHHICFFKEEGNYLVFYDSGRLLPIGIDELSLGYGLSPNKLRKIIKQTEDTVISRVALKSSNIGSNEPHSHSFMASSVEETAPNLNDFSHFLSSTFGHYIDKKVFKDYKNKELKTKEFQIPTYIGFATGRVSQSEGKYVKFNEFLKWVDYIGTLINSDYETSTVFERYSTEILNQNDPVPQCILLDLYDFERSHKIKVGLEKEDLEEEYEGFAIPETFHLLTKGAKGNFSFTLEINKKDFVVEVKYDEQKNKYYLISPEIEGNVTAELLSENKKVEGLIKAINRKQCFRILTEKGLSYSGGRFYKPHFKFDDDFNEATSPIAKMIFSVTELDTRHSEKGTKNGADADKWENNSIFDLIDKRGVKTTLENHFIENEGENEELLICTDMNTEPADFIYVTNKKLVFIHVKGKGNKNPKKSHYGATPISDICTQAVKNSHYLSIFNDSKPGNLNTWSEEWKMNDNYKVKNRIRNLKTIPASINPKDPNSIWEYIQSKKLDVNISKEKWLIMGYTMTRTRFIEAIGDKPKAEAKQAALTLESTMASIHAQGVKLKVFCS